MDHTRVASDILCEFLEVAFHSILYVREIYPAGIFERRRKYNVPVQMSCHPDLNKYIQELLQSVKPLLEDSKVERVSVVILNTDQQPQERFVFEIAPPARNAGSEDTHLLRLEQSLRAFLLKLNICDALLSPRGEDCTWTVHLHTTDSSALDLQQKQLIQDFTWIEADKSQLKLQDPKLIPLKTMDSSVVKMQLYVEEGNKGAT